MSKLRIWLSAMRLRTLPLSLAGIILGSGMAAAEGKFDLTICVLALLTAASYQILSNLANDYGDGIKGTDAKRTGPARAVASGWISLKEMKTALIINGIISFLLTVALLKTAFPDSGPDFYVYLFLGMAAIWAAVKYTVGKKAYGYAGLGDLFVLIFFGWVSVAGVYYLYTRHLDKEVFAAATAIGLLAVAVLNINNMRDLDADRKAGKITFAVKLGRTNALKYHRALIHLSFLFLLYFTAARFYTPWQLAALVWYIPLTLHLRKLKSGEPAAFNKALKQVSLYTFFLALTYGAVLFWVRP